MNKPSVQIDLCGVLVTVEATSDGWISRLVSFLEPFVVQSGAPGPGDHWYRVSIEERIIEPPTNGMPLTWAGRMNDGNDGEIYEADDGAVLVVRDGGVLILDHANLTARAYFRPAVYSKFFGTPVMMILEAALAGKGQELVHAGCLVHQKTGRAILIAAPSGSGKTTTCLALAHDGFGLMTDDASVLMETGSIPMAWGLPRTFKVHHQTAKLLPWIGNLPDHWDDAGEQGVPIEELDDRINFFSIRPVEVGAVILLGPRSKKDHQISPISKSNALIALAHENVAWRSAGMVPKARKKFGTIANIVSQTATFELNAGSNLASLASIVEAAFSDTHNAGGAGNAR